MVIDILDEEKKRRKYPGYPCQEKCTDPSGRCKCRSGDGHFAISGPAPNLSLLDRFPISMERQNVPVVGSVLTKVISQSRKRRQDFKEIYENCWLSGSFTSVKRARQGQNRYRELLKDKTTVVAGPSGVGKSSMINFSIRRQR